MSDAPGTRQILHAEEHPELLRRGRHQHRLALPLARLERHARVAHLAREQQRLEIGQRLVDDDRPQPRGLVHHVRAILLQIPRGRLLDVEDAIEAGRRRLAHPPQELEQVADVRAAFVEVEQSTSSRSRRAPPATRLTMRSMRTTRSKSASRLPPLSLILKRIRPSRGIHSSSVFGSPSSIRVRDVGRLERIAGADRVKHRHARLRRRRHVAIEVLTLERRAEIGRQIAAHERRGRRSRSTLTPNALPYASWIAASNALATTSVQSFGIGAAALRAAKRRRRRADTRARAHGRDRSDGRVSSHAAVASRSRAGERAHRAEPGVLRRRRKRPGVAQRHRAEAPRLRPPPVRTRQLTLRSVTRSTDRPPNWYGARYWKSSNA